MAPEAEHKNEIADTSERSRRFVGGLAAKLLESVARGEGIRESDIIALASAVLTEPEIKLAVACSR